MLIGAIDLMVLDYLEGHPDHPTIAAMCAEFGWPNRSVMHRRLNRLLKLGYLKKAVTKCRGCHTQRVYYLVTERGSERLHRKKTK